MYAHVTNGTIDSIGALPKYVNDGTRDWDLRPRDPALLAQLGWYEVDTSAQRPADTATTTSEAVFTFDGDGVARTWRVIDKTAEQLASEAAAANAQIIRDRARAALAYNATAIDELATFAAGTVALTNTQRDKALRDLAAHQRRAFQELNALIKLELQDLADTTGT